MRRHLVVAASVLAIVSDARRAALPNEDGYDLWLRYRLVANADRLAEYRTEISRIVVSGQSAGSMWH